MVFSVLFGIFGYFLIAVGVHIFCEEVLKFRDEVASTACAAFWPIFIAFWLTIGWPAMGIHWVFISVLKRLRKGFKKTHTSEVK